MKKIFLIFIFVLTTFRVSATEKEIQFIQANIPNTYVLIQYHAQMLWGSNFEMVHHEIFSECQSILLIIDMTKEADPDTEKELVDQFIIGAYEYSLGNSRNDNIKLLAMLGTNKILKTWFTFSINVDWNFMYLAMKRRLKSRL